ncbi:hypothetical protein [Plantibacter sp. CFBP 13570]|uniref:hypothetical protein n=1 Tax=Plantibacter sp. CFBP 13570 TaxID=2775272 RepID=UPI001930C89C|nr:hypothetical protein [Plantibacter sp. CFBP 13570]MBD8535647.1 hypothetical protein [Plantibacter sp. CFBP 13570]
MSRRSKKITFALSIGVVGVIAVTGLAVGGVQLMRGTGVAPPASGQGAAPGQAVVPVGDGCSNQPAVTEGTVSAAPETTWAYLGRVAVPTSPQAGPFETADDGFPSCFAHTPEGALLYAANMVAVSSDRPVASANAEQMYAESPRKAEVVKTEQENSTPNTAAALSLAGFRVLHYDGDMAAIDTAWRVGPTLLSSVYFEVRWENGDWRIVPPAADGSSIVQLPNLGGYIPWSAS